MAGSRCLSRAARLRRLDQPGGDGCSGLLLRGGFEHGTASRNRGSEGHRAQPTDLGYETREPAMKQVERPCDRRLPPEPSRPRSGSPEAGGDRAARQGPHGRSTGRREAEKVDRLLTQRHGQPSRHGRSLSLPRQAGRSSRHPVLHGRRRDRQRPARSLRPVPRPTISRSRSIRNEASEVPAVTSQAVENIERSRHRDHEHRQSEQAGRAPRPGSLHLLQSQLAFGSFQSSAKS